MTTFVETKADAEILKCLEQRRSFSVIAGAGSGKTRSLVETLKALIRMEGPRMRRDAQKLVCITYTNRAAGVITNRIRQNPLVYVSTLHSFLWGEIGHFPESIRGALSRRVIPDHIAKQKADDNGGNSQKAIRARDRASTLEHALENIDCVDGFRYGDDTPYSNYLRGEIGHDDLIVIAAEIIETRPPFRRILRQKFPFILVDEAQDTSPLIIGAFNTLCDTDDLPIVAYFGDPMQQIYDNGMGDFRGPDGSNLITKDDNFRSAPEVIEFLNAFREDVKQVPSGRNKDLKGSVRMTLVNAEKPGAPRNRYTDEQLARATQRLEVAMESWGWQDNAEAKKLFLARRMIARRIGFLELHDLFNGEYASTRAKNAYEDGTHFLLKPLVEVVVPLVSAHDCNDSAGAMRILTTKSVAFRANGMHAHKSIREVRALVAKALSELSGLFRSGNLRAVFEYCLDNALITSSQRLTEHLDRSPREEVFDEDLHGSEKGDWLADAFFELSGPAVQRYVEFLDESTPYSTQHGVKGEEYDDVVVVFDDVEAAWNNYAYSKLLTPHTSGEARDSQRERSRKLAYVCFSRAIKNLRILLFTTDPGSAKKELVANGLFAAEQIEILP